LTGHYHAPLVLLSIFIAMLASYTALDLANSVPSARGRARLVWLIAGSLAMGTGIWSMHFVGMLAFHLQHHPIAYFVPLVVVSVLVAIAASFVALYNITQARSHTRVVLAGLAMGAAIAGMHYTGMAAMRTDARIAWSPVLVGASILIAIGASFAALELALRVRSVVGPRAVLFKLAGGAVMGLAIAGMHYIGMAAASFVPFGSAPAPSADYLVATNGLAIAVIGSTVLILAIAIGGSILARELGRRTDLAEQLRVSEEYYRALIENASDLIAVVGADGRRTYVSPSYTRILGYEQQALLGRRPTEIVHPDDANTLERMVKEMQDHPRMLTRGETRLRHQDGSYRTIVGFAQNLIDNPAVRGIVLTGRDETERRSLELQFQQAQKMEAVGKLAGGVAHDFNNLLTVILGNVQLMLAEGYPPEVVQGLNEVRAAAERAAGLTRQLLAFSRRQVLQPRVLSLNDVVNGIQGMLARLLTADVHMSATLDENAWPVLADSGQVEQALMNLAVNARDAMPNGGRLRISTRNVELAQPLVSAHDVIPAGDYACLSISDAGTGISAETLPRMFEPFFTTKEAGKGTGLGLATVYGIMKQSGGYITVDTTINKGTTFQLFFPRVVREIPDVAQVGASVSEPGHATILVVEDEAAVQALVKRVLEKKGYTVLVSGDADEALRHAQGHSGPIHLLLTDVVLPDLNGREVSDRITLIRPGIRSVFMSGYTEDEVIRRGALGDGITFIQKPFSPAVLINVVQQALAASD
jgi:PAS domain S-box-containing protein